MIKKRLIFQKKNEPFFVLREIETALSHKKTDFKPFRYS